MRSGIFRVLQTAGMATERAAKIFTYAAAGVTRKSELRTALSEIWRDFGDEESLAAGLLEWEKEFLLPHLSPGDSIFVAGCGRGREMIALRERGFDTAGQDLVPECVEDARQNLSRRGWSADLFTGPVEEMEFSATWNAVILGWYCYSYIPERVSRIRALRRVRDALAPNGRIFISYIPAARRPNPIPALAGRIAGALSRSDWRLEPGDVITLYRGEKYIGMYEHRFLRDEIEAEVRAAGLSVAEHGKFTLLAK